MNTDYWQCQHTFGHILKQYNKLLQFKTLLSKPILLYSIFSLSNNNCGSDCKNDGTSLPLRVNTTGTMRRWGSSLIASLKLMPHPTLSPLLHVGPNARPCEFDLNSLQNTDQYKQRFQKKKCSFSLISFRRPTVVWLVWSLYWIPPWAFCVYHDSHCNMQHSLICMILFNIKFICKVIHDAFNEYFYTSK